ncbi:N-acetylneuraminate synthase family protein [Hyphococcus flavus]|uniref:N-acetylneuraminate synthase family protein n=1 Tax=Hyphococcus flavus TaxID=1866326 RepID=A0AAF0CC37_9PROT|nr:N-acetylneuraminate synthase family protein [Hyphococcus flavus]WDI32485.1 N-acetylneuraminate synthase family protein [Hyphococcus flavus]
MDAPKVVAEIGCNHKGDLDVAKKMVVVAASFCEADAVKFQKRNNRELLPEDQYNAPHPNPINSYGPTYGEHREYLEFNLDQHRELKAFCEEQDVIYSTSVWDVTSAKEIASLEPDFIKVPSASNLHFEMMKVLRDDYGGKVQLSLGMTTQAEEDKIIAFYEENGRAKDLLIYACTSGYPVPIEDVALLEITRLQEKFGGVVDGVGFSGHHLGIAVDIAATTLGAKWIERHFTLDRTWKGTDHAASLEPDGLRRLCRDARAVAGALTYKKEEVLPIEQVQRDKLKWRAD